MSKRNLEIGDVVVPLAAAYELDQSYEDLERSVIHPMANGRHYKQVYAGAGKKLKTVISGRGSIPVGLQGLDFTGPQLLKCLQHRSITSPSNIIALPPDRYRTDINSEPYGRAFIPAPVGRWVNAEVTDLTDGIATLEEITNATNYQVVYFPQVTVLFEGGGAKESRGRGNNSSWTLTAYEE